MRNIGEKRNNASSIDNYNNNIDITCSDINKCVV